MLYIQNEINIVLHILVGIDLNHYPFCKYLYIYLYVYIYIFMSMYIYLSISINYICCWFLTCLTCASTPACPAFACIILPNFPDLSKRMLVGSFSTPMWGLAQKRFSIFFYFYIYFLFIFISISSTLYLFLYLTYSLKLPYQKNILTQSYLSIRLYSIENH